MHQISSICFGRTKNYLSQLSIEIFGCTLVIPPIIQDFSSSYLLHLTALSLCHGFPLNLCDLLEPLSLLNYSTGLPAQHKCPASLQLKSKLSNPQFHEKSHWFRNLWGEIAQQFLPPTVCCHWNEAKSFSVRVSNQHRYFQCGIGCSPWHRGAFSAHLTPWH